MYVHGCAPTKVDRFSGMVGEDGVMMLKLTGANSSELIVQDVVCNMWLQWRVMSSGENTGLIVRPAATSAPPEWTDTGT